MEKFVIEGGVPLSGTVEPAGNKNAALPLLACALLTPEPVILHNVPHIRDTEALLELLEDLGVSVTRRSLMNTARAAKSIDSGPKRTIGSLRAARNCRRIAECARAKSSAMPNGLTT